jgi:hypothetical protein
MLAPQDLESELDKEPFRPFRIVTTGGKSHDITEKVRPLLLVGKRSVIIGLRVPETDPYFDRYEVVSLVHIIRLEPLATSQGAQQPA